MELTCKTQKGGPNDGGVKFLTLTAKNADEMEILSLIATAMRTGQGATIKPSKYTDLRKFCEKPSKHPMKLF
jgi:hypothetical protein